MHWGQAVGCSVACLGSLTIWLIKFSKPQTNHSKNLIKCVKKIVYYFYKNKVVCLQFYNHFFISSFSHNSFLSFTFLLPFLHLRNVLLCTLYTWGWKVTWKFKISHALNIASIIISISGNKATTLAVILKSTVFHHTEPWFSK